MGFLEAVVFDIQCDPPDGVDDIPAKITSATD